ncbi:paraquat-inducible protein A [Vibrio parahaemolyticus]|uniref:paraquat-inducible protein A n=1 Tax=Vibrio parahaemolyticus TaxID=670 RepID=UPI0003F9B248|nr:paraquat-inducible protein A [Vibrio parahaemolyticus]EHK4784996.1 paraquat-inducible protein A [Vibrio parahaemolyticus]EIJ0972478.1 paraquat-inducible protein A [Vibrio parahaemolyticus]EJO4008784.1 paraquat-inducible protein A [Vibrio parahaemolyticus]MBM4990024.1 paraquat-inducible protein A [Vibrio parahaemolyticus]MBM4993098.1 paraquat-inducible protein A [Vibrio parahaemolyticus]
MSIQPNSRQLISCEECGLVVRIPEIEQGQKAQCPRCSHSLTKINAKPYQSVIAVSSACLIMLVLSISFPFMSFSVQGLSQEITLLHAAKMLAEFQNALLGALLLATVVVLPAIYVGLILFLHLEALKVRNHPPSKKQQRMAKVLCRILFRVEPWLMVDVFLIGVLVSLIKIASLADIGMGSSFWAFCVYTILVVKCISMVDKSWLWGHFIPAIELPSVKEGDTHHNHNHIGCHTCHQLNPIEDKKHQRCIRCYSRLHEYNLSENLQKAWALLFASVIFYIPANLYPMMYTVSLGHSEGSTIMEGVILLWHLGSYPIAMVIFFASVFIPMAKMLALAWLYYNAQKAQYLPPEESISRLKIYRLTEFIGRWSMIDIFVVAILVALVQLQNLMAIYPGPAALSFAAVVIFTMLSAMIFDSRLLWQLPQSEVQEPMTNNLTEKAKYE